MSRLLDRAPAALLRALITFLLALGLGMPPLVSAGLPFLLARYALLCAGTALLCALFSLRRGALPVLLLALAASQGVLYFLGGGFFRQSVQLARALMLLARDVPLALRLYGDVLCSQLAVWLTLFCFTLSSPDVDVILPVTLVTGLLGAEWMLGNRRETLYMLPVLPGLLLAYASTHSFAITPETRAHRPSLWAVPVAAVLLALSWLIAPQEGVKAKPLADLADTLREAINDRFFFQQERARYTLYNDGWMPLGEHRLGGRPDPDEHLVMRVTAPGTVYLRGAILDTYTGAAWYDSISTRRYYWNSALQRKLRDQVVQSAYPLSGAPAEQRLHVDFLSAGASTLFTPQRVRELQCGERMTPYFNLGSELFITRSLKSGDSYDVTYLSMQATDAGMAALAESLAEAEDPGYQEAVDRYTSLPGHIQQEVYNIAAAATANCVTPWQRATALRSYLKQNYRYTLDVQTPPADVDFVAWFLLAEKEGYCTYFASALTVLCRMAGLPARYVEGYAVTPDASGLAEVRGTNAHAWTEVYLNGLGWITLDATPGRGSPDNSGAVPPPAAATPTPPPAAPEVTPTPTPTPTAAPTDTPSPAPDAPETPTPAPQDSPTPEPTDTPVPTFTPPPETPPAPPRARFPWLWLLLALVLIALLAVRMRVTAPLYRVSRMQDDRRALTLLWNASLACAAALKVPIQPEETPMDYAGRAAPLLSIEMAPTAQAVSALRYGRRAPRRADLRAARALYAALWKRLNPLQKSLLALRRALRFKA